LQPVDDVVLQLHGVGYPLPQLSGDPGRWFAASTYTAVDVQALRFRPSIALNLDCIAKQARQICLTAYLLFGAIKLVLRNDHCDRWISNLLLLYLHVFRDDL
jgi:hypothetical protein